MLHTIVKNKKTYDKVVHREKEIKIYVADDITEIYAIPNFIAFYKQKCSDRRRFARLNRSLARMCRTVTGCSAGKEALRESDFSDSVYYLFNCGKTILPKIRCTSICRRCCF